MKNVITLQLKMKQSDSLNQKQNGMKLYRNLRLSRINSKGMAVMDGKKQLTHAMRPVDAQQLLDRLSKIQKFR